MKTFRVYYSILFFGLFINTGKAQTQKIDSLNLLLKASKDDTSKVNLLNALCIESRVTSLDSSIQYAKDALNLAQNLSFKRGIAKSLLNAGFVYRVNNNPEKALEYTLLALKVQYEIGNKTKIIRTLNVIAELYNVLKNYDKGMEFYLRALKLSEEIGDKNQEAKLLLTIGIVYQNKNNFDEALRFYNKSFDIFTSIHSEVDMAGVLFRIGDTYYNKTNNDQSQTFVFKGMHTKALDYILKAKQLYEKNNIVNGVIDTENKLAYIYAGRKEFDKSLNEAFEGLALAKKNKNSDMEASIYGTIGDVYYAKGDYETALIYLDTCYAGALAVNNRFYIRDLYFSFASIYSKLGNYKKAYEFQILYTRLKDTLISTEYNKQLTELSVKYETAKKDQQLVKKDDEISKQQLEADKRQLQRNGLFIVLGLVLLITLFMLRSYNQKKAANELLELKNDAINKQKLEIEKKNNLITDSIEYAKNIQQSILPAGEDISRHFKDHFILYRPKDIVSGDFYWFHEGNDRVLLAVADCTGHGVPGAFMSLMCNNLLNDTINENTGYTPAEILNELNTKILQSLKQNNQTTTAKYGMDICLISVDKRMTKLEYAGAHNPLFIFRNKEFIQIKATGRSIGSLKTLNQPDFQNHSVNLKPNDMIYMFSDGYADQFGGPENKKFFYQPFKELLLSICELTPSEQSTILEDRIINWKGNRSQIDDILVLGIRI